MTKEEIETFALTESGLKRGFDREEEWYYQRDRVRVYDTIIKIYTQVERDMEKCWDDARKYEAGELELDTVGKYSAFEVWRNKNK